MTSSGPVEKAFIGLASPHQHRAGAGGWPCQGIYYTPAGARPRVAMIATHYNIDFSQHYLADYMAARGVGFLGWNTRFRGDEAHFLLDHALVDIATGVRWLRENAGVETVILLGNSGGGSLMSAYQSHAVNPNVVPLAGMRPARGLDELIAGDAFIALAAHPGRPDVLTSWMDASATSEQDVTATDPSLDLWNPQNGPPYSPEFLERYRAAQVARNLRITAWAKQELARLSAAGMTDQLFTLARTWADPRMVDPSIDPSTRKPNWCYMGEPRRANRSTWGIGGSSTLRTWLSMWSLETSQCRAEPHLANLHVPTLVISADSDTGVYPGDAKAIFAQVAATDKAFVSLPGDHYFAEPDDARDKVADLLAGWVAERFTVS
jgi:pimeloyl-ACP methyl ester carboxylesterase